MEEHVATVTANMQRLRTWARLGVINSMVKCVLALSSLTAHICVRLGLIDFVMPLQFHHRLLNKTINKMPKRATVSPTCKVGVDTFFV